MLKRIYVIRTTCLATGTSYCFSKFVNIDGVSSPKNCTSSHLEKAAVFSSIAEACKVVRQIDRSKWRCVICPTSYHLMALGRPFFTPSLLRLHKFCNDMQHNG